MKKKGKLRISDFFHKGREWRLTNDRLWMKSPHGFYCNPTLLHGNMSYDPDLLGRIKVAELDKSQTGYLVVDLQGDCTEKLSRKKTLNHMMELPSYDTTLPWSYPSLEKKAMSMLGKWAWGVSVVNSDLLWEQNTWWRYNDDVLPRMVSHICLLYTSPSPRDRQKSRMPSSA